MPKKATVEQRIAWHAAHQKHCACRPMPESLRAVMTARQLDKRDKRPLALWAADCAGHVLPFYEQKYPKDRRARKAIEAARGWVQGEIPFRDVRAAALAAHVAARAAAAHPAARAAANAAATAHAIGHAVAAARYATAASAAPAKERAWQLRRLPKDLTKAAPLASWLREPPTRRGG